MYIYISSLYQNRSSVQIFFSQYSSSRSSSNQDATVNINTGPHSRGSALSRPFVPDTEREKESEKHVRTRIYIYIYLGTKKCIFIYACACGRAYATSSPAYAKNLGPAQLSLPALARAVYAYYIHEP